MVNLYPLDTIEDIDLLQETVDLECKKAAGKDGQGEMPKSFWETYSAMANTDGGVVLLGVQEINGKFSISGILNTEKVKKSIVDAANDPAKVNINMLNNQSIKEIVIDRANA